MRPLRAALAACIVLVTTAVVRAQECVFLPYPGPIEHTQPDGTRIEMFRRGDAFRHWLVDARGHALVETDRGVRYARLGADGAFEATDELASARGPQGPSVARNVVPTRATGLQRPSQPTAKAGLTGTPAARGGGSAFVGGTGTVRNLVLLLRFSNHGPSGQNRTLPSAADVTTIMNAPGGHPTLAPTGSVRDHYLETSYGQFTIDSTVVGWLDMPNTEQFYGNGNSGLGPLTHQLIAAGLAAADPLVDFDQFDQDGDGWIDAITILHSGYGAEFGGIDQYGTHYSNRMWSHKWAIPTWTSAEGVRVSDYNISPGLWDISGSAPGRIGVVCHELGHFFGLPDLYDTDGSSEGDGNWCLMAAGSWGFNGTQRYPSHMSAWSKIKLGWVNPTTLLPGAQTLPRVESNATIHKIDSGYAPGEYLLIENRQQFGFDAVIPQGGLAIWHIDESKGRFGDNNPNNAEGFPGQGTWPANGNHYRNALVQADGLFDLENGNDRGDGGDVFRSGGVAQLLSTGANLNTDAYQPGFAWDNGNQITGIGASSATMTYTFGNATTPPVITTASLPAGALGAPYSTTLASNGGTAPKTWSEHRAAAGYALTDLGTQTFPLTGTARNWRADDGVWALDLPFAFPYWETQYTRVHVSSNGTLDLSPAQSEWGNRPDWLRFALRIAPLWDDLRTDTAGKDIFTDTTVPGQVRIRWAASHADTGVAVNFAVMLFADGRIRFEYGTGNTNLTPTVGISRGEGGLNVIPPSHDGQTNLTSAHGLLFTLQGSQIPPGLTLSSAGVLSGTPTQAGTWMLRPRVTDAIWRYDQRPLTLTISGGDSDGDGVPDGADNCPGVPNASQSNADGDSAGDACDTCTDTDGDGFGNPGFPVNTCPTDGCPNDPLKSAPGVCGCGVAETDTDGDGTPNCIDGCPNDPLKIAPGLCGCGVPDTDSDGDGTPNCTDGCPNDPLKIAAGQCGCGVPDTDADGDGTANCNDGCPNDPGKTSPGACGCGIPDTDSDGDGTANCNDGCPNDPLKTTPGPCGCGVPNTDSDGDGTPNCNDGCPNDPLKLAPGICGCGIPDTDSDGDGTANCNDGCPNDPNKTSPGLCGCGTADTDSDGDGTPNCTDGCPSDPLKITAGQCGCGVPDTDTDGDGTANCNDGCPNDPLKTTPGACGCGIPDTDGDGDGTPNCTDGCPNDPLKIAPGICGCGVPDTDSDGDGTANCNDGCPNDPNKTAPGLCGCGTADTDSDGDGTPNCTDGCPNDPLKIAAGQCGCGVPDTDSDGDGTANCNDGCPNDPNKTTPGACGCGTPDTDTDGDGTPNCTDGCPNDPLKIAAGQCGCGVPDTDADGDGTANCNDGCPNDPSKTAPGACGCGTPDTDSDGDGTPNCTDGCPSDPLKIAPGICGCGVPDTDSDGDGTANCNDGCPSDPNKTAPGLCGCGTPDTDSDGDGTPNCTDGCPNDPLKIAAGQCGCGVPDTDSDGDGTANCNDGCPNDPLKIAAGQCGCGVPDTDADGDGTANCNDGCPNDPSKTAPGACGCGIPDTDSDGDGTPNCTDGCPSDPLKIAPGICGCGVPDTDSDGDGTANCNDGCPNDPNKTAPGLCGCGTPDTDSDGDGTPNCTDGCPNDPLKIAAGQCGCGVPDTDSDGDGTANCNDGCPNDPSKTSPGVCGCGTPDTDSDSDGIANCNDNCDAIPNPGQADCDADGVGDACALAAGAPDCNQNAIPDVCDIANGTSLDADGNGVPDECSGALTPFCFGDGSGTACPCGNTSLPADHAGCLNSLGTGGRLVGAGSTSVTADTLVLSGTAMPNSSALYFQGTGQAGGGAGAVFGDGLRCPAGGVIRLGTKTNAAGASQYPAAGDPPVSVRGAIPPTGGTRHYQVWYRNAANFCTSSTFNLTNGLTAVWVP